MLSNTSRYAIRAVIYISLKGGGDSKIGIKQIANELGIPTPFLGKILQTLAKHKLLTSSKGPHGGFGLGKDPYEISLLNIVEVIDGLDDFESCVLGLKTCSDDQLHCSIHRNYASVREQLKQLFNEENVGTITEHIKANNHSLAL
jgi:Rrf2 family protein